MIVRAFVLLTVVVLCVVMLTAPVSAAEVEKGNENAIRSVLTLYFQYRENQVEGLQSTDILEDLERFTNTDVPSFESSRKAAYRAYEEALGIKIVSAEVVPEVLSITVDGERAIVTVYEWTWMEYKRSGPISRMGAGVDHTIVLAKDSNRWVIEEDRYDEGPRTGVRTVENLSSILVPDQQKNSLQPQIWVPPSDEPPYPYIKDFVANYADAHAYENDYNNEYRVFYYEGEKADCANFVSQCILEGGLLMIGLDPNYPDSHNNSNGYGTWWYDDMGTSETTDDQVTTCWSWTSAPSHRNIINQLYGTTSEPVHAEYDHQVKRGNPVYYDWYGDGVYNHAAICVGQDADGHPIVDAHSADVWHHPWDMGYTTTIRSTILITDWIYPPGE